MFSRIAALPEPVRRAEDRDEFHTARESDAERPYRKFNGRERIQTLIEVGFWMNVV
jgi:hypothetical protein